MEKEFIKISEAAKIIGVTPKTLRTWEKEGKLKSVRTFGKHRRYKISEITKLFEDQCN